MCVFHERQPDICRCRTYSQGFANFDPAFNKPLPLMYVGAFSYYSLLFSSFSDSFLENSNLPYGGGLAGC